jgi:hypothetical protein
MGSRTEAYFEYGTDSKFDRSTPRVYCGRQITPRSVLAPVTELKPGTTYQYRLVAENDNGVGVSEPSTLTTPQSDD